MFSRYLKEMDLFICTTRIKILSQNEATKKYKKIEAEDIIHAASKIEINYTDSIQLTVRDIINQFSENEIRNLIFILEPLTLKRDKYFYSESDNSIFLIYRDTFFTENDNKDLLTFERDYLSYISKAFIVHYSKAFVALDSESDTDEDPSLIDFWKKKLRSTFNINLHESNLEDAHRNIDKFELSEENETYLSFLKSKMKNSNEETKKYEMGESETTELIKRLKSSSDIKSEYIDNIVNARKQGAEFYLSIINKKGGITNE